MSDTDEMTQAAKNLEAAMRAWKIVQQEDANSKKGVLIDNDTLQKGVVVPTRMEYVRTNNGELEVTRIIQGGRLFYGVGKNSTCHESDADIEAFFNQQPQMAAVFTAMKPDMMIPFGRCHRGRS